MERSRHHGICIAPFLVFGMCNDDGHCVPGTVPVDPWMTFALQTQLALQVDEPFIHVTFLDAHNAYNNRADDYGKNDTCLWPPPYNESCIGYANHEFSITDMLNMGIRGVELDNWYCLGTMRLAHLAENFRMNCQDDDKLFADGIKEIADWLNLESNAQEIIRIYLNEKSDQGYDQLVNGPINTYLGGRVLTPRDLNETYQGTWPTLRQMKKDGKNVVIATASSGDTPDKVFTHGDLFIHKIYWTDRPFKEFTPYPECGGRTYNETVRYYSDSSHFPFLDYDGPTRVGVITDLSEMMKCRIEFPACDHVNPELIKTAVYTWAESEPSEPLTRNSCVKINSEDNRWYVVGCDEGMHYACQNANDPNDWIMSESHGPYTITENVCPSSYKFSVPHNGHRHQKLIEAVNGTSVWINYSPWLPGHHDPGEEALTTEDPSDATDMQLSIMVRLLFAVILATTLITY